MNAINISQILPHRYPFVLVDRILEIEYLKRSRGYKNISNNEPWVEGHFPDQAVYPGVLMIETMGQVAGFMFYQSNEEQGTVKMYLCGVNNFKIMSPVLPGDRLTVDAELYESVAHLYQIKCIAKVDDRVIASGMITLAKSSTEKL